jgi:hypothetical protein
MKFTTEDTDDVEQTNLSFVIGDLSLAISEMTYFKSNG